MRTLTSTPFQALLLTAVPMLINAAQFKVGEPFPTILLPSLEDGRAQSIEDFRGQKLMLHIFASW